MKNFELSEKVKDFIDLLQEKFPTSFPKKPKPKVALKINIYSEVKEWALKNGESGTTVRKALKSWCSGKRYFQAILEKNAIRHNMYGDPVDIVTKEQKDYTNGLVMLAEQKKKRKIEYSNRKKIKPVAV